MQFNRTPSRYRLFDAKTQRPILADDKKDKQTDKDPKKDFPNQDDDDLKNVDQSKGGYGDGTGFSKE
ncbi:hypothetical protein LEM8419_02493 [Neolewinella maritima]|uniref:Uncharacterized protein n=1 Tax=Neolewinella maritima TaxID=1383882 RepID=A0ABM9B336_9BACT|nr:hypothetical protein [Neolewinella maritima]CAH1001590.1 hypothetical protein LEM8419_02493 [Neolewinella maritima]